MAPWELAGVTLRGGHMIVWRNWLNVAQNAERDAEAELTRRARQGSGNQQQRGLVSGNRSG